ncbi:MAG: hypothetical protein K9M56_06500 [Victivallales bacterium]|nr:hypothetical protein [Victivallales bacterium]
MKKNKSALVIDDKHDELNGVSKTVKSSGYHVETATSIKEAKLKVLEKETFGGYELIVSDYDFGSKLWQKHHMFDGAIFLMWCIRNKIKAKMIMHSTVFEPHRKLWIFIHGKVLRIIPLLEKHGIVIQAKSKLLN